MSVTTLRPSTMPKLAVCSKFENSPFEAGPSAKRGTLMDEAFRLTIMDAHICQCDCGLYFNRDEGCKCIPKDEVATVPPLEVLDARIEALGEREGVELPPGREAVEWAIKKVEFLSQGHDLITDEEYLWVDIEEMDSGGGTMDADCPELSTGFDLKSGQIRNYKEQFASYALGRMRASFSDRYTMIGVFCDQKETVTHNFTYEEAEHIVKTLRAKHLDPNEEATPCEYCSWCGAYDRCQTRKEVATRVAGHMNVQERWEVIKEDPEELAEFITGAGILEQFVKDGKKKLLEFAMNGVELIGFHKRKGKVTRTLPAENLLGWLREKKTISLSDVIRAYGPLSEGKFKKLAESAGESVEGVSFIEKKGEDYVQKSPTKKKAE